MFSNKGSQKKSGPARGFGMQQADESAPKRPRTQVCHAYKCFYTYSKVPFRQITVRQLPLALRARLFLQAFRFFFPRTYRTRFVPDSSLLIS